MAKTVRTVEVDCRPEGVPMICDFCSSEAPVRLFPCHDVELSRADGTVMTSIGGWWACELCAVLIEADDSAGLEERALAQLAQKHGVSTATARAAGWQASV